MPPVQWHHPIEKALPVVASIPHSGTEVPPAINALFTNQHARWLRNTDWFLPEVYSFLPAMGVRVVAAKYSRYVVDLNRNPQRRQFGPFFQSVIAERTADGADIYVATPTAAAIQERIRLYHRPYHQALKQAIQQLLLSHPRVLLLDLHSFMQPIQNDICLGDGDGATCRPETTRGFKDAFAEAGFDTVVNKPFNGGYIIREHASLPKVQTLQIELRYTNYMNTSGIDQPPMPSKRTLRLHPVQERLKQALEVGIRRFVDD